MLSFVAILLLHSLYPAFHASAVQSVRSASSKLHVTPSILASGQTTTVTLKGGLFTRQSIARVNGKPLATTYVDPQTITFPVNVLPWWQDNVAVEIAECAECAQQYRQLIRIKPTSVSFDTAARFSNQVAFGPRPDLVLHIQQVGLSKFIDEQMALQGYQYFEDTSYGKYVPREMQLNAIEGQAVLRLRVAYSLETFITNGPINYTESWAPWQRKLEADAFGNFRDLLSDIASSPLMGRYLNLANNWAATSPDTEPNQNFGREIMQLYAIGQFELNEDGTLKKGPNGTPIPAYDQQTVAAMSRVFTGWTYPPPSNPKYTFYGVDYSADLVGVEAKHDHATKTLFNRIELPAGQTIGADRTAALDAIFNHPNVPPHVCQILIQKLVKSSPSPQYVKRIASVFKNDGHGVRGNLAAVIRAILLDPEARMGDTTLSADDGFLHDTVFMTFNTFTTLQMERGDDQPVYISKNLGQEIIGASVFYYYPPTFYLPGSSTNSPEFAQLNGFSDVSRSQVLWKIISGNMNGTERDYYKSSWLFNNFETVPDFVEATDHLIFHGRMPPSVKQKIIRTALTVPNTNGVYQRMVAVFLALNADSALVSQ